MNTPSPLNATAIGAAGPAAGKSDLRIAAEGFEAIFVRRMLEAARAADFGGEVLVGGAGMEQFTAMRDEHLAEIAGKRGVFGIADAIEAQLARRAGRAE